jgi:hypothetical protein
VIYQKYSPPFISKLLRKKYVIYPNENIDKVQSKIGNGALISFGILPFQILLDVYYLHVKLAMRLFLASRLDVLLKSSTKLLKNYGI